MSFDLFGALGASCCVQAQGTHFKKEVGAFFLTSFEADTILCQDGILQLAPAQVLASVHGNLLSRPGLHPCCDFVGCFILHFCWKRSSQRAHRTTLAGSERSRDPFQLGAASRAPAFPGHHSQHSLCAIVVLRPEQEAAGAESRLVLCLPASIWESRWQHCSSSPWPGLGMEMVQLRPCSSTLLLQVGHQPTGGGNTTARRTARAVMFQTWEMEGKNKWEALGPIQDTKCVHPNPWILCSTFPKSLPCFQPHVKTLM